MSRWEVVFMYYFVAAAVTVERVSGSPICGGIGWIRPRGYLGWFTVAYSLMAAAASD